MKRTQTWLCGAAFVAAGAIAPALYGQATPAPAAPPPPATADSAGLLEVAAVNAREVAARLEAAHARRPAREEPGAAAYRAGLEGLQRNSLDTAITALQSAVLANDNEPRYHGDLGFALAAAHRWHEAEDQYRAAVRLQGANAWYYVGLGAVQVADSNWAGAAANFTLAVQTDSAVIVRQLVGPASDAFDNAQMRPELEAWCVMATRRFPSEPLPWLRLAKLRYMAHDTAEGFPAIRHYRTLRPDDKVGAAVYAEYLLPAGQDDSAAAMAIQAAGDTALRPVAAAVLYNVGGHFLQRARYDSAVTVLQQGLAIAPEQYRPQFNLFVGVARFKLLQDLYNQAAAHSDCGKAQVVDTMLTSVTSEITAGAATDSALAAQVLNTAIPRYRQALQTFKQQCGR